MILFNFFLSESCTPCKEFWPKCEKFLKENKIIYKIKTINIFDYPRVDEENKKEENFIPEKYPAMGFSINSNNNKFYIVYGEEDIKGILENYILFGEKEFTQNLGEICCGN